MPWSCFSAPYITPIMPPSPRLHTPRRRSQDVTNMLQSHSVVADYYSNCGCFKRDFTTNQFQSGNRFLNPNLIIANNWHFVDYPFHCIIFTKKFSEFDLHFQVTRFKHPQVTCNQGQNCVRFFFFIISILVKAQSIL